jgi:hypothetical protein
VNVRRNRQSESPESDSGGGVRCRYNRPVLQPEVVVSNVSRERDCARQPGCESPRGSHLTGSRSAGKCSEHNSGDKVRETDKYRCPNPIALT